MRALAPIAFLAAAGLAGAPAAAQEHSGRYSMAPTADGLLRLDTRTGAVSECRRGADGYQCRLIPEERSALESEIDRLQRENAELKERLAKAGEAPAPGTGPKPNAQTAPPSEAEFDRALGAMERFLRRFMGILREEKDKAI